MKSLNHKNNAPNFNRLYSYCRTFAILLAILPCASLRANAASSQAMDYMPDIEMTLQGFDQFLANAPGGDEQIFKIHFYFESIQSPNKRYLKTMKELSWSPRSDGFSHRKAFAQNNGALKVRLWELFRIGAGFGIAPSDLRVKFAVEQYGRYWSLSTDTHFSSLISFPDRFSEVSISGDMTSLPTSEVVHPLSVLARQTVLFDSYPIRFSARLLGYKDRLFSAMMGWDHLLPPRELLSLAYLRSFSRTRFSDPTRSPIVQDVLDLLRAYAQIRAKPETEDKLWKATRTLRTDFSKNVSEVNSILLAQIMDPVHPTVAWKTIIQYLQDVLTVVQYDLDANPSEVASLLAREYYSKPTVQVIVNATDSIAQNKLHRESNEAHDQQLPRPLAQNNAPSLEPDYVQDYYRQKMRSERAKQAGEVAGFGAKILGGLLQTLVDSAN